jgi:hypothetical protein
MARSARRARRFLAPGWSQHGPSGINQAMTTAGKTAFDDAYPQVISLVGCPTSVGRVGLEPTTQGL